MHNPRPLERWVGRLLREREPGVAWHLLLLLPIRRNTRSTAIAPYRVGVKRLVFEFPVANLPLPPQDVSVALDRQSVPMFRQHYLPTNRCRTNRRLERVHHAIC